MAKCFPQARELRYLVANIRGLIERLPAHPGEEHTANLMARSANLADAVRRLANPLSTQPYPFPHGKKKLSLSEFLVPGVPDDCDVSRMAEIGQTCYQRFVDLHFRLIAYLSLATEEVESAMGLSPLPDPLRIRE